MRNHILSPILGILLLFTSTLSASNEESVPVTLEIRLNGKGEPPPSQITLEFNDQSEQELVRDGSFQLPAEARAAKSVGVSFKIRNEQIRIPTVILSKFTGGTWTVLLEDKSFGEEYKSLIPKGANIRSSCIWLFEPNDSEATASFVSPCRYQDSVIAGGRVTLNVRRRFSTLADGAGERALTR